MAKKQKKTKSTSNTIALNKRARHEYHVNDKFEAGVSLAGWEVKSIREGKVQITDAYVIMHQGEVWLMGAHITPLISVSTHIVAEPTRNRKLLLHKKEIAKIFATIQQKGQTCVPLALYWKNNKVKCEIALVTGKQQHDKRATEKDRDWGRQKARIVREHAG
ncbi:SsrA-binding protein SmpB [Oceanospirillum sediminis]|uniref:SsrA-binding protein n=1 Tax=Oceanospirillum sediminis TaxID=2760088 RepID=A0A839IVI2_9GAMM|nr:SsrA-binding protein SmpB [Oceanospirillum sediminis]MBB1488116.1 SsrA-binding protein SmpB [Oceanospirillum sediminis]